MHFVDVKYIYSGPYKAYVYRGVLCDCDAHYVEYSIAHSIKRSTMHQIEIALRYAQRNKSPCAEIDKDVNSGMFGATR